MAIAQAILPVAMAITKFFISYLLAPQLQIDVAQNWNPW
jgi:hypothetical protein